MDPILKRDIILDNYTNPENKEAVSNEAYIKVNSNNESCIDNIDIYILIENGVLKDIKFDGEACAISTASSSIMTKELVGKTIKEAKEYISNFENMIEERPYDIDNLGESIVFDEIYKQANRKTCALLPYKGIMKAILKYEENHKE